MTINVYFEEGRLKTFDKWPHADDSFCSKEKMAKAGFYYTGISDCVKCFVCSIKLNNWDSNNDEPWSKHLESSDKCIFAKIKKEQKLLTIEELCDVLCDRATNKLDKMYNDFNTSIKP